MWLVCILTILVHCLSTPMPRPIGKTIPNCSYTSNIENKRRVNEISFKKSFIQHRSNNYSASLLLQLLTSSVGRHNRRRRTAIRWCDFPSTMGFWESETVSVTTSNSMESYATRPDAETRVVGPCRSVPSVNSGNGARRDRCGCDVTAGAVPQMDVPFIAAATGLVGRPGRRVVGAGSR